MPSRAPAEIAKVRASRTATGSSTPAPARSSCSTTQLRPAFLAAYSARSARSISPAGSASRGSLDAAPTETVSGKRDPRISAGVSDRLTGPPLAGRQQVVAAREPGQQHDELLAAPAGQRVVAAQRVGDAPGDVDEHLVADGVAEPDFAGDRPRRRTGSPAPGACPGGARASSASSASEKWRRLNAPVSGSTRASRSASWRAASSASSASFGRHVGEDVVRLPFGQGVRQVASILRSSHKRRRDGPCHECPRQNRRRFQWNTCRTAPHPP